MYLISARLFPSHAAKHLKWKLSPITPVVVRKTILNSGFRLVRSESPDNPDPPFRESLPPHPPPTNSNPSDITPNKASSDITPNEASTASTSELLRFKVSDSPTDSNSYFVPSDFTPEALLCEVSKHTASYTSPEFTNTMESQTDTLPESRPLLSPSKTNYEPCTDTFATSASQKDSNFSPSMTVIFDITPNTSSTDSSFEPPPCKMSKLSPHTYCAFSDSTPLNISSPFNSMESCIKIPSNDRSEPITTNGPPISTDCSKPLSDAKPLADFSPTSPNCSDPHSLPESSPHSPSKRKY